MSKVVKVVAGAALMFYAPVLVAGFAGSAGVAFTAAGYYATVGALTLAGASLAGSALAPEMPDIGGSDAYAGQKLQTKKDNVSAVPQVFGENRVGGNIIWQSSGEQISGADNKDYWAIIAAAEGEIDSFVEMYANEDTMVDKGSNKFTTTYAHIKGYTTSGASGMRLADVLFVKNSVGDEATASSIGINTYTEEQTKQVFTFSGNVDNDLYLTIRCATISGGTYSGTGTESTLRAGVASAGGYYDEYSEGWHGDLSATINYAPFDTDTFTTGKSYFVEPTNVGTAGSVSVIQQPSASNNYEARIKMYEGGGGEQNMSFNLQMKEGTGVHLPSNLAFLAVHQVFEATDNKHTQLDNITALIRGKKIDGVYSNNPAVIVEHLLKDSLNIDSSAIDSASFANAEAKRNEYGYTANISFYQQVNIQSAISDVLATCRGQIVFSQGKWKLKIDEKNATVVKALTSDDILNSSLSVSMKGFQEIANKIDLKYINPLDNWLSAKVEKIDTSLISMDGQEIVKTLDIKGITNTTQANKLAEITLNSMRYTEDEAGNRIKQTPLAISFATTIKNAELEVGDVISLDHDLLDRVRKFVILSVETDQSGAISMSCREYCETHYKDSSGVYII